MKFSNIIKEYVYNFIIGKTKAKHNTQQLYNDVFDKVQNILLDTKLTEKLYMRKYLQRMQ